MRHDATPQPPDATPQVAAQASPPAVAPVSVRAVSAGLDRLAVHTLTLPCGRQAVLEAPVYRSVPRARLDLIRHRGTAYDRLCGDTIPSPVPTGYAGAVEDGVPTLLSQQASGLPLPHGPGGWVVAHHQDDGHVTVRLHEHDEHHEDAASAPTTWGTSTRSLLGLRSNPAQETRLWRLGDQVVWLRQEHSPSSSALVRSRDDRAWPQALVTELFEAALCTVMVGPRPLPGLPRGVVVLLEAQEPSTQELEPSAQGPGAQETEARKAPGTLVLGLAQTPRELSAFLHEDHVPHHLVTPGPGGTWSPSPVGDLPRSSVAHRLLDGQPTVVFTERLETATTSYRVSDGSVLACVEARVDHYTGVPGLSSAWVEHSEPHLVQWATGSWTDGTPVTHLQEEADGVVTVMTQGGQGHQEVPLAPGAWQVSPVVRDDPPVPPPPPAAHPSAPILWCPSVQDPVAGQPGLVLARREDGHMVEVVTGDPAGTQTPLVWFDDSSDLPAAPVDGRDVRHGVDLGTLPVGDAAWCHAGTRPVVRVSIDYHHLAALEPEGLLSELHQAWRAAVRAISDMLGDSPGGGHVTPFLGGHSFGAALAAVAVLRGLCSPAGALLRSGAYDRYATPHGFEHDHRTAASHPGLYRVMSVLPRAGAHRGTPFLISCGGSDQNSATTPQQSLALHENLLAAQADTTLAVFPEEGHVFSSRQALLERRRLEEEWMRSHPPHDHRPVHTARPDPTSPGQAHQQQDDPRPTERKSQP
ncbi:S9 family peptidase [Actinomyces wuliandei]|uniref:S9 family peptidase n=1 Tax=Actinomyces wuliandei TaxID=2057743 RepID=UPI001119BEBC|nr:prolyl oligopeptidase family serine peptidase [Actinomyces wuliandei]